MKAIQDLWRRRVRVTGVVEQVAVGSPADMAAIYEDYWHLVHRRCLATLRDEQAAEDATQDVFLIALSNFEQIQHDVVRGLLDIARTISYERRHRPSREVTQAAPQQLNGNGHHDDPAEIAARHDMLDEVWAGLSAVERRYVADKFAGFSNEEIARRNRRKLGTVSSNLFRAREHARTLRGPTASALLGAFGWRRLTGLTRRARNAAHSTSAAASAQPVQTFTLSLTLAGLLAGVAPAASSVAATRDAHAALAAVTPSQPGASEASGVAAPVSGIAASAPSGTALGYAASPRPSASGPVAALPLPASASSETPEDTVIYTATPSPNYDSDHTILAIGRGNTCSCSVLLRSTDGGASWTASSGVPDGDELALPPAYPQDPRIFVGYQYEAPGTTNWWAPSFGSRFEPLPGPAGAVALPAGFDSGDQRVIVSALSGIWSDDLTRHTASPLIVDTSGSGIRALATPPGASSTGVFALTSSQGVTPGTADTALKSPGLMLWACPPGSACEQRAGIPLGPTARLSSSPEYGWDHALAAYSSGQAILSRDGGSSFSTLEVPADATRIASLTLGSSRAGTVPVWLVAQRDHGVALEFSQANGSWHEVDHGLAAITAGAGVVVVLDTSKVMYLSNAGGFMCTADDGATWSSRCPMG